MLVALIPAILWLGEHILGPLTEVAKVGISEGLRLAEGTLTGPLILQIFEKVLGPLEDTKKQQLINELDSMLGQIEIVKSEIESPKSVWQVPHELLEYGAVFYLLCVFLVAGIHVLLYPFDISSPIAAIDLTTSGIALSTFGIVKTFKVLQ